MSKTQITQSLIRQLMDYDPLTGICVWKTRTPDIQPDERLRNSWNSQFAGKQVGFINKKTGYMQTAIRCKMYQLHRLIWVHVYGKEPDNIDHINSVRHDNRLVNLRSVTREVNNRNAKRRHDNPSGVTGIKLNKSGTWLVRIRINKKLIVAGCFADFDEAVKVRLALEVEHGFHSKHGKK